MGQPNGDKSTHGDFLRQSQPDGDLAAHRMACQHDLININGVPFLQGGILFDDLAPGGQAVVPHESILPHRLRGLRRGDQPPGARRRLPEGQRFSRHAGIGVQTDN